MLNASFPVKFFKTEVLRKQNEILWKSAREKEEQIANVEVELRKEEDSSELLRKTLKTKELKIVATVIIQ